MRIEQVRADLVARAGRLSPESRETLRGEWRTWLGEMGVELSAESSDVAVAVGSGLMSLLASLVESAPAAARRSPLVASLVSAGLMSVTALADLAGDVSADTEGAGHS